MADKIDSETSILSTSSWVESKTWNLDMYILYTEKRIKRYLFFIDVKSKI